jgi:hypothetical protein
MQKILNLATVATLCISGLFGCGGTIELESEEAVASIDQSLWACLDDGSMSGGRCPGTQTCVNTTALGSPVEALWKPHETPHGA